MTGSSFDHRPDAALGAALRELLTPEQQQEFLEAVRRDAEAMGLRRPPRADSWAVLSRWTWPGLAAAAVIAIVSLVAATPEDPLAFAVDEPLVHDAATPEELELLFSPNPPDVERVLASTFEFER